MNICTLESLAIKASINLFKKMGCIKDIIQLNIVSAKNITSKPI